MALSFIHLSIYLNHSFDQYFVSNIYAYTSHQYLVQLVLMNEIIYGLEYALQYFVGQKSKVAEKFLTIFL